MFRSCAVAALALVLAACKSSVPQPPAALPGTCSGDSECGTSFRCDREMRRCVCTSDAACPGKFCNAFTGLCVDTAAGCTSNNSCALGQYCNTALRTCRTTTPFCQPCKSDNECGAGNACAAHPDFPSAGSFCVAACDTAGACANGLACRKSQAGASLCYPAGACGVSNACIPDSLKPCAQDADCGDPAQTCDQTLKACITRNASCPAGDACDPQSLLCVQACSSDDDCLQFIEKAPGYAAPTPASTSRSARRTPAARAARSVRATPTARRAATRMRHQRRLPAGVGLQNDRSGASALRDGLYPERRLRAQHHLLGRALRLDYRELLGAGLPGHRRLRGGRLLHQQLLRRSRPAQDLWPERLRLLPDGEPLVHRQVRRELLPDESRPLRHDGRLHLEVPDASRRPLQRHRRPMPGVGTPAALHFRRRLPDEGLQVPPEHHRRLSRQHRQRLLSLRAGRASGLRRGAPLES